MSGLSPQVEAFKTKYQLSSDDLWSAHGTWCLKHRAIQSIAWRERLTIDLILIAADQDKGTAIFRGECTRDGVTFKDWGEASPANNKNAYPVSMAEKRAYDRVALQALGIHGYIHSAEEMVEESDSGDRSPPQEDAIEKCYLHTLKLYINNQESADWYVAKSKGMLAQLRVATKQRTWDLIKTLSEEKAA